MKVIEKLGSARFNVAVCESLQLNDSEAKSIPSAVFLSDLTGSKLHGVSLYYFLAEDGSSYLHQVFMTIALPLTSYLSVNHA